MKLILRLIAVAVAAGVATLVVPGIRLSGTTLVDQALTLAGVAVVFALVNAVVKPLVQFFSGCLILITLGVFLLVINAAMLLLTSWVCAQVGIGFHVDGWWAALLGSVIISVVSWVINGLTRANEPPRREA